MRPYFNSGKCGKFPESKAQTAGDRNMIFTVKLKKMPFCLLKKTFPAEYVKSDSFWVFLTNQWARECQTAPVYACVSVLSLIHI